MRVFYNEKQNVTNNDSFSPSAGKPAKVLAAWQNLGLPIEVTSPKPCSRAEIALAHDPIHVQKILSCKRANGFGNTSKEVAKSLPWTTGSFVSAALYAWKHKVPTVSLTSGFHHSSWDVSSAFCTFNGLMIAAQALRLKGVKRIGILDCDEHYGNGTDSIIEKLDLKKSVKHWTLGNQDISAANAESFLAALPGIIQKEFQGCKILFYQAGADCWIGDPLGGRFTKEQLQRRDRIVFETCKELGIVPVWNLAGGYASNFQHVLDIHSNTMIECLRVYEPQIKGLEGKIQTVEIYGEVA